jgi:tetratricopeptide (TPR) repeat protein
MRPRRTFFITLLVAMLLGGAQAAAQDDQVVIQSVRGKAPHIRRLNGFVDELLRVHRHRLQTRATRKSERVGGYANDPHHFRDIEYFDAGSGQLLSRIRRENKPSGLPEMIEVYFYDGQGKVRVDYLAIFLPGHRNAPFSALVNVHDWGEGLTAWRQFDLFGEVLFERCQGTHRGEKVDLWLDETRIPPPRNEVSEAVYLACFGLLPEDAGEFMHPAALIPGLNRTSTPEAEPELTHESLRQRIAETSRAIDKYPVDAQLYLRRGQDYFLLGRFADSIADFTAALRLDDSLDAAYFGRGMAYGRDRQLDKGIADLSVYIRRNPQNSLAYTKRGVRHIWNQDFARARDDLQMAVSLDAGNAEAHDDLGVALAQLGEPGRAIAHFQRAIALEPSYQKAHHNLALALYLQGEPDRALRAADDALRLQPDNRGSALLKSNILERLGRKQEALQLRERAEFMSEGTNWSERSTLR